MSPRNLLALTCLAGTAMPIPSPAIDHFLLVGGGPFPPSSQVSIEKNVIWIDTLMRERSFATRTLLFTSGQEGPPDVVLHAPNDPEIQRWLPLARLFGDPTEGASVFRRNELQDIDGAATAGTVADVLRQSMAHLGAGDSLFFVYNGHGSWTSTDTSNNALRLWGESRLNVRQFAELLDSRPVGSVIRYVMPQCFSGGFARTLTRDLARPRASEIRPDQCGFFSVPDDAESEGCTPGVDVGEYRDYSTFFFAALTGRTRLNEPLQREPDLDKNGRVSLSEAHAYAFTEGSSTDVPYTTSEYYLELWQPWYARWQSTPEPSADNPYFWMAKRLAKLLDMKGNTASQLAAEAISERRRLAPQIKSEEQLMGALSDEEASLRKRMRHELEREWPAVGQPYTAAYADLLANRAEQMLAWIQERPDYPELVRLQTRIAEADLKRLDWRRKAALYARVHRAISLAAIRENFDRLASDDERARYDDLLQCESWAPPATETPTP